jgi:hypothetical protein
VIHVKNLIKKGKFHWSQTGEIKRRVPWRRLEYAVAVATQLVPLSVFSNDLFLGLPTLSFLYLADVPLGRMRRKDSAGFSFKFI